MELSTALGHAGDAGSSGGGPILKGPVDVAVARNGTFVAVSDAILHRVVVFSPSGAFLRYIGQGKGTKLGRFDHPWVRHVPFARGGGGARPYAA